MQRLYSKSTEPKRHGERGYMLLYLMFLVAVLAISLVTIVPTIQFVMKRDAEQEMVHRGEQYRRAVRRYYRKMGSYPVTLDVLENSNDMRFLRKRYKDPMNHNKDFKVLTQIDLMKAMGTALSGNGGIAGAQTLGQPIGGDASGTDPNAAHGTATPDANSSGAATVDPNAAAGQAQAGTVGGASTGGPASGPGGTVDKSGYTLPFTTVTGQQRTGSSLGGAAIVGVASLSGAETIRIYNKKNHYKDWLFIYDPSTDRGGLLTGPYQPQLQTFGQQGQGLNGQNNGMPGFGPGMNPGMGIGGGLNNGFGSGINSPGTMPGNQGIGMQH